MSWPELRIGQGFDVHPFSGGADRPLVLGGVTFEGALGLAAHSDGDAVAHAITDAVLGAAGLGDIGEHFPDTDPAWQRVSSIRLLGAAMEKVSAQGWRVQNVDCTVVLETPKLAPRRAAMQTCLGEVLGAPVTVKGKRPEGLGALGRSEGVACFAVALLVQHDGGAET